MRQICGWWVTLQLGLLLAPCPRCAAQTPAAPAVPVMSLAEHAHHLQDLKSVLLACDANPAACDANRVGPDELVQAGPDLTTRFRYDWLRSGIRQLATEKGTERSQRAAELRSRLDEDASAPWTVDPGTIKHAQAQVAQVLAQPEFAPEPPPNWLQRKWAAFWNWVYRQLSRTFIAASSGPGWVRIVLEGLLLIVPVILLAIWLVRQVREDRRISHERHEADAHGDIGSAEDWLARAQQHARDARWRDAIHALYWATIAQCESRRIWTASRTRTPREYLRLLKADSPAKAPLREQTQLLEITWYGYRDATPGDYDRAQDLHRKVTAQ